MNSAGLDIKFSYYVLYTKAFLLSRAFISFFIFGLLYPLLKVFSKLSRLFDDFVQLFDDELQLFWFFHTSIIEKKAARKLLNKVLVLRVGFEPTHPEGN